MNTLSDNALMMQVKEGDLDRMGLLFQRYHRALFGFLFHMTGQRETSEDIVQNVFLRMLKYRSTFTGMGEFKTWMYHLARNVLHDHNKKNKKSGFHYNADDLAESIPGNLYADTGIEKKQELQTLALAMMDLGEENRELLILCRFQGLKYAEIASLLGISEAAVKVRVHRAMAQLKGSYLKIAD